MAASIFASGNATAVVGTPQTLSTVTTAGTYQLALDLSNMVAGDTVVLKVYTRINASGAAISNTSPVAYYAGFNGAQVMTGSLSPPIMVPLGALFELNQTAGTARTFQWAVVSV